MFERLWNMFFTPRHSSQNATVRFAFPVVALLSIFAGLAAVITEESSYITITTTPTNVREGELIFIDVYATAHTAINAVDLVIKYPENQLSVTGVDVGESVITLWAEDPYAENGSVYLRGGTFGRGFVGEHKIARVRAEAIESGSAQVTAESVQFIAGDGLGTAIDATDSETGTTKLYIANADGSLVGEATVNIVTDVDGDGKVDMDDIQSFMSAWRSKNTVFDFNGDGKMSFRDFAILLADSFFK